MTMVLTPQEAYGSHQWLIGQTFNNTTYVSLAVVTYFNALTQQQHGEVGPVLQTGMYAETGLIMIPTANMATHQMPPFQPCTNFIYNCLKSFIVLVGRDTHAR